MYDGHVHIRPGKPNPQGLKEKLGSCGIEGAVLISMPTDTDTFNNRLSNLMNWCDGYDEFIPFFWLDPLETGAIGLVKKAIENNVSGFKIICDRFYPGDKRCLSICKMAADAGKPILFHSGILWDGKPSSEFCRPVHFESLLTIKKLRFSLAHIGWPWCDEMIAVYGKFLNFKSRNPQSEIEMYIDMTPGTPKYYREEAIRKLFLTGYDIKSNLIFGSDCDANNYNSDWTSEWISTDLHIYSSLNLDKNIVSGIYLDNLMEFINGKETDRKYKGLKPAVL